MPSFNQYEVGDTIVISAVFRDTANNYVDPSGVVYRILSPAGWSAVYTFGTDATVVRVSQGQYYCTALIPSASATSYGRWTYHVAGTGVLKQASQGAWTVQKSPFFP